MGIGPWHIFLLVLIVLIFFGPSKLPTLGKSMGEAIRGFKKGLNGDEIDVTESAKLKQGSEASTQHTAEHATDSATKNEKHSETDKA